MKRLRMTLGQALVPGFVAAAWLALAPLPMTAATSGTYSGTGYVVGVPVPGIQCTNAAGQVSLLGNVHVVRVEMNQPQLAGRLQATMDLAYQADGTMLFGGKAYHEVGTWDLKDPANPKFTRTDGVWNGAYQGVAQADGSDVIKMTACGIGGSIDGLRSEWTITKGPGVPFDPAVPYTGTVTILPPPVDTTNFVDNFEDGRLNWPYTGALNSVAEANGQLTFSGNWPGRVTTSLSDTVAWAGPDCPWTVRIGQTLEARVDLVSLTPAATAAFLTLYHVDGQCYGLLKANDWVAIGKHIVGSGATIFGAQKVTTRNTNVVLVLSLTPDGQNVILAGQVLDKGNGAVLCQLSAVDTPASDPALTASQFAQITGLPAYSDIAVDPAGGAWTNGTAPVLFVFQQTDGKQPAASATFDNLELRTHERPPVGIESALVVTYPSSSTKNWRIEWAPSVEGGWSPYTPPELPGLQQLIVRKSGAMGFFRMVAAP